MNTTMKNIDYENKSSYCFVYDTLGDSTIAVIETDYAKSNTIPYLSSMIEYTFVLLSKDISVNEFKEWLGTYVSSKLKNIISSYDPSNLSHPYKYELYFKDPYSSY